MAEKGGTNAPGSCKGKDSIGKKDQQVLIETPSSSDLEGFLDDDDGPAVKSGGKSSFDSLKNGKRPPLDSWKSGDKAADSFKGESGKGGKDYKTRKVAGKGGAAQLKVMLETDVKLAVELPKNAEILTDCEAGSIFQGIQEFLPLLSQDPSLKMPVSFTKALQHVQDGVQYTSSTAVRKVLKACMALIESIENSNLKAPLMVSCPETPEEAYALVPSLKEKKKNEEAIQGALSQLAKLKRAT